MKALAFAHRGFTLLELATSMAVITIIVVGTLSLAEFNRRVEQGKAVGKLMLLINNAVIEYKDVHRAALIKLPEECGKTSYGVGFSTVPSASNCSFTATTRVANSSITVNNGMQPTIDELKTMGFLESGFNPKLSLPLDTARKVSGAPLKRTDMKNILEFSDVPDTYGVVIQRECVTGTCNAQTGPFVLKSLVFNIQPYRVDQKLFGSGARLGAAVMAMGGAGYVSMVGGDGKLRSPLNQVALENPVQDGGSKYFYRNGAFATWIVSGNHTGGAAGILAAYDGRGFPDERYTYRDGTRLPTQDWDFNKKKLTNIDELGAQTVKVKGDISAEGKISAKDLEVKENSAFRGNVKIDGQSSVNQVAYKKVVDLFSKCNTDTDSFALKNGNNAIILACQGNEWRQLVVKQGARSYRLMHWTQGLGRLWYARIKMGYTKYDGSHYEASKEILDFYGTWDVTVPEGITDFRVSFEKRYSNARSWELLWMGPLTQELYEDPNKRCLRTIDDYDDARVAWCNTRETAHVE